MAVSANATYLAQLIDPQVIGDMLEKKLCNAIKFAPLATVDSTLVGTPGSTITLPSWKYIGIATVTAEGNPITINKLQSATTPVQVKKLGNGVEITDEAVLSGFGDPIGQAVEQLALSIADGIDADIIANLNHVSTGSSDTQPAPLHHKVAASGKVTGDDISNALVLFGEDIEGDKVVLVNGADYANIRKDSTWIAGSEIGADIIIKGTVGMIHGCQVVVSNRVTAGTAYIVKPNALGLFLKRDVMVESDRDIINKTTVLTADKHFATYLVDASKAIKLDFVS